MKSKRTCPEGHSYFKTSDCPTCPVCEQERKPANGFMVLLSAPAIRALERENISTLEQVAQYSKKEIAKWHGIGPKVLEILTEEMKKAGLDWR